MDGIVQLLRCSLIRQGLPLSIAFEIDVDLTGGGDVARGGIVGELGAVNLVEAVRVVAVDDDVDFVQNGPASLFELLGALGMDAEQGPAAFGFRKRESFGALLNIYVKLLRGMLNGVMDTPARVKI